MSDIIHNDAAHPLWRRLCQAAVLELDPKKLLNRIAEARTAILGEIEGGSSNSSLAERLALSDALYRLTALREIAQRDLGEQRTGS
jgi:hypothetical protein